GRLVGPYVWEMLQGLTGSAKTGLIFMSVSLVAVAILVLAVRQIIKVFDTPFFRDGHVKKVANPCRGVSCGPSGICPGRLFVCCSGLPSPAKSVLRVHKPHVFRHISFMRNVPPFTCRCFPPVPKAHYSSPDACRRTSLAIADFSSCVRITLN